jgi:hypothetical protein
VATEAAHTRIRTVHTPEPSTVKAVEVQDIIITPESQWTQKSIITMPKTTPTTMMSIINGSHGVASSSSRSTVNNIQHIKIHNKTKIM